MKADIPIPYSRALVTGGAGFIGSHLTQALCERGCRVVVLDNFSSGNRSNLVGFDDDIEIVEGDIRDLSLLESAADGCEAVFHQAAVVSVPQTVEDPVGSALVNETGTLHVLEAARRAGAARVVIASSSAVYGDDPHVPKRESMPVRPMSPYAVHKAVGEQHADVYHRLYGLETVSLRYFNVYGPRQDPGSPYSGVISIFLSRAAAGLRPVIFGDGKQYRDFIYVSDVVKANLLAAATTAAAGGRFNIGTGTITRIRELWDRIAELAGTGLEPEHQAPRAGDIVASVADIDRARSVLGFSPRTTFSAGLRKTWQWFAEAGQERGRHADSH